MTGAPTCAISGLPLPHDQAVNVISCTQSRLRLPAGIDPEAVKAYLSRLSGVTEVHDLHIWAMSTKETALTAHLVKSDARDDDGILEKAGKELHDRFGIAHTTIQWERRYQSNQCGSACEILEKTSKT